MYVYLKSEKTLWTVGFYDPAGQWLPESDYTDMESAAKRTAYLNGEDKTCLALLLNRITALECQVENHGMILERTEKIARKVANEASCLANGIQPD